MYATTTDLLLERLTAADTSALLVVKFAMERSISVSQNFMCYKYVVNIRRKQFQKSY